ncbi:MAG: hypothetical protein JXR37_14600 [Kiritimatiellae bacterium]|nr:hypothetical protein [Kiritimatiellia bacterium]
MRSFLRRCFMFMLLSGGIALLVFPFSFDRASEVEGEAVRIDVDSRALVPEGDLTAVPAEALAAAPKLAQILRTMRERTFYTGTLSMDESQAFTEKLFGEFRREMLLSVDGTAVRVRMDDSLARRFAGAGQSMPTSLAQIQVKIERVPVLPADGAPPVLAPADLADYPELKPYLRGEFTDEERMRGRTRLPVPGWRAFAGRMGWTGDKVRFVYDNRACVGEVVSVRDEVLTPITGLRTAKWIVGGLAVLLGLLLVKTLYVRPPLPGIPLSPRWGTALHDGVTLLFGTLAMIPVWDEVLARFFGAVPRVDDLLLFVSGLAIVVVGFPWLAALACSTADKNVQVGADGVRLFFAGGRVQHVAWDAIEGFNVVEKRVPLVRGGFVSSRSLGKALNLATRDGIVPIGMPLVGSTKERIMTALRRYAPQRLHAALAAAARDWF